jgi:hypothetical protein
MLVPVQTSGSRPPLFFVHGLHGVMPLGPSLARALGPEHPIYGVNANGIDGRRPIIDDMREMIPAYVEDIKEARPTGRLIIGGMCDGSLAAIEIARELKQQGREVGPVILADPTIMPRSYANLADEHGPQVVGGPAAIGIARKLEEMARQAGVATLPDFGAAGARGLKPEVGR